MRRPRRRDAAPAGRLPERALLLAGALLLGASCGPSPGRPGGPPLSVVLVTLDTTRADALGAYDGPPALTPTLDALARESVVYDAAYTVTPLTLPAHASLLTGLVPLRHGVRENGIWSLPAEARTTAELARDAGLQTAAFVAAVVLDARFGLDQGFEVYDAPQRPAVQVSTEPAQRSGHEVVAAAGRWLREERDPGRRFFLWVHLFDPHGPWDPPARFRRGAGAHSPYHAEVAVADEALGELLATLRAEGLLERSLVAVVADHGEGLGDHGEPSHGPFAYESTLRVPLFLRYPDGWRAGEREERVASVVDLFPTALAALGIEPPPGGDGVDLFRRRAAAERGAYFETYSGYISYGWSPLAGWIDPEGKYVHSSRPQLFDVRADPGETRDLIEERADEVPRYRAAIARTASLPRLQASAGGGDAALAEELRALGYAGAEAPQDELPEPLAPSDRPSPPTRMEAFRRALAAMELANRGALDEAVPVLRELAAENPRNYFVLDRLGDALKRQGRFEEAIGPLRRVADEGPAWSFSLFTLGVALLETGRHDEALAAFRRALAEDPGLARTVEAMVATLRRRGQEALAERYAAALLGPGADGGRESGG